MMYGTIKSEVWAHMPKVAGEYFRFEVMTRWYPQDEKDDNNPNVIWKTTIVYVDRDGDYKNINDMTTWDSMNERWKEWLNLNHASFAKNGYEARSKMRQEHDYAIMLVIG